jgi:hypothetical protein
MLGLILLLERVEDPNPRILSVWSPLHRAPIVVVVHGPILAAPASCGLRSLPPDKRAELS